MKPLLIAFAVLALLIWGWMEYFRAIPDLEQAGVQKNFQVNAIAPMSGSFMVLDKSFYSPNRGFVHPASSVTVGSYQNLIYLSNIDLLLAEPQMTPDSVKQQAEWSQENRCYTLAPKAHMEAGLPSRLLNVSVIAATAQAANQLRRIKPGQRIHLQGDWAEVKSAKNGQPFSLGIIEKAKQCRLLRVSNVTELD